MTSLPQDSGSCRSFSLHQLPSSHSCPVLQSPSMVSDIGFLLHLSPRLFRKGFPGCLTALPRLGSRPECPLWPVEEVEPELPAGEAVRSQTAGARRISGSSTECLAQPVSLPSVP